MPEYTMPELKPVAEKMIRRMQGICDAGSGSIPPGDVLNIFSNIPPEIVNQIGERGNIDFNQGNMENTGDEKDIRFQADGKNLRVIVPTLIISNIQMPYQQVQTFI